MSNHITTNPTSDPHFEEATSAEVVNAHMGAEVQLAGG
jgi:hypothetical protein